jgi:hypothetical protein
MSGLVVKLKDEEPRYYADNSRDGYHGACIEGEGCLTVYRVADPTEDTGHPIAGFAPGQWLEWHFVE